MQKISVDLIRLAVSSAAICVVVGAAEFRSLQPSDSFVVAKTHIAPPIQVKAISIGAPALCWTMEEPIGATATQRAQGNPAAIAQTCSSVPPTLRRLSEPESQLALAS